MNTTDIAKAMRRAERAARVEALRDGRKVRPQTFKSGKEYRRKGKHGKVWA